MTPINTHGTMKILQTSYRVSGPGWISSITIFRIKGLRLRKKVAVLVAVKKK